MRLLLLLASALILAAQTPEFEVASLRLSGSTMSSTPLCDNIKLTSESTQASGIYRLDVLIINAYKDSVDDFDLPQWIRNNGTFSISVKVPPNTSVAACRAMLRSLLAERFHVVTDVETRDVTRYYVRVAKAGLKLKPVSGPPADGNKSFEISVVDGQARQTFRGQPVSRLMNSIAGILELDARFEGLSIAGTVDETGLTGYFDGEIQYNAPSTSRRGQFPQPEPVQDAIERQLGLTAELRKAPGKVLVLRSSDRTPTEN